MPAPVYIDFVARGMPQFSAAMKTVQDSLVRFEQGGVRTVQTSSRAKDREYQKLAASAAKWQRESVRSAERAIRDEVRAAERGAKDRSRVADRVAAETKRNQARESANQERVEREKVRAVERSAAAMQRIRDRSASMAGRYAVRQIEAQQQQARQTASARQQFAGTVLGAAGSGFKAGMGRVASATQQVAGTVLGIGGGFSVSDSVNRASALRGQAADIANSGLNATSSNAANHQKRSTNEIVGATRGVAIKYGIGAEDAMKGLQDFTSITGDLDTGLRTIGQMAELSRATGSSLADVAGAAGNVAAALPDSADKAEKVMAVMRGIAGQGKLGAVEIKDMATQMGKLVASSGKFEGDNVENIMKLGALAQAARGGGGAWNAASATTAVGAFTSTFGKGARLDAFKAEGIQTMGAGGQTRDPIELLAESISKTGGDQQRMNKLFGSVMADRATAKYVGIYREAEAKQKGSGKQAIIDDVNKNTKGAMMSKADVTAASKSRVGETDAQFASMREKFDEAVEQRLIPKLLELVPVIEKMIPIFIDLQAKALPAFVDLIKSIADFAEQNKSTISFLASHPIGTMMFAEVSKSIAGAAIGEGIKGLLAKLITGSGGGAPGTGGAGSGLGGALGAGALAGAATYATVKPVVDATLEGQVGGQTRAGVLTRDLLRGTPEEKAAALKSYREAQGRSGGGAGVMSLVGNAITAGPESIYAAITGEKNTSTANLKQTVSDREVLDNETLKQLVAAIQANTSATQANSARTGAAGGAPAGGAAPGGNPRNDNLLARNPFDR